MHQLLGPVDHRGALGRVLHVDEPLDTQQRGAGIGRQRLEQQFQRRLVPGLVPDDGKALDPGIVAVRVIMRAMAVAVMGVVAVPRASGRIGGLPGGLRVLGGGQAHQGAGIQFA